MADMATNLARRLDGNIGQVARLIGGEMMAAHRDADDTAVDLKSKILRANKHTCGFRI